MDHSDLFDDNNDFQYPALGDEQSQTTPIWPPLIREEIEESVKRGLEASLPALIEEAVRRESQALIPALVEGVKRELQISIPILIDEAVKREFRATIPILIESFKKEVQSSITAVVEVTVKKGMQALLPGEETNRRAPSCLPLVHNTTLATTSRLSTQLEESSASGSLHLVFLGSVPDELFTKMNIEDQGVSLKVELRDKYNQRVVSGLESSAKIKISVIDGDLDTEMGYTEEDINEHVVKPRENKPPLLKGKYDITLSKGIANVGEIAFTDNSASMRNGTFRLGAQVKNGVLPGVLIKGAVGDPFMVKERRTMLNRMPRALILEDDIRYLVNIGNGKTRAKFAELGVHTVKDFLQFYQDHELTLRTNIRGDDKFKRTLEMAKACIQTPKQTPGTIANSQKLVDPSSSSTYDQRSELTISSALTKQTMVHMMLPDTIVAGQDGKEMQSAGCFYDSCQELDPSSTCTLFERQMKVPEFYGTTTNSRIPEQAETISTSFEPANMQFNVIAANEGVMLFQPGEAAFSAPNNPRFPGVDDLSVDNFELSQVSFSNSPAAVVGEENLATGNYKKQWRTIVSALKFKIRLEVSVKQGTRALKRQKVQVY